MSCDPPLSPIHDRFTDGALQEMLDYFQGDEAFQADDSMLHSSSDSENGRTQRLCDQSGTSSPITTSTKPGTPLPESQVQRTLLATGPRCGAFLIPAVNGGYLLAMQPQPDYAAIPQDDASQQASGREYKQHTMSHSTIEKQRRDRINSLIDELRKLVPSGATLQGPDGVDLKRPKHVVLSDTISLVKRLQEKVLQDELELQQLKQQIAEAALPLADAATAGAAVKTPDPSNSSGSAQSLIERSLSGGAPAPGAAAALVTCPELPQAPVNLPASVGVVVEEGPGCYLVKVNCKDRRGLLSDITAALRGLPLQIARAAITTSGVGAVYDVFEILAEPGEDLDGVSALDIQFHVHQALLAQKYLQAKQLEQEGLQDSGKRRRSE